MASISLAHSTSCGSLSAAASGCSMINSCPSAHSVGSGSRGSIRPRRRTALIVMVPPREDNTNKPGPGGSLRPPRLGHHTIVDFDIRGVIGVLFAVAAEDEEDGPAALVVLAV